MLLTACGADDPAPGAGPPLEGDSRAVEPAEPTGARAAAAESSPNVGNESILRRARLAEESSELPTEEPADDPAQEAPADAGADDEREQESPTLGVYDRSRIGPIAEEFRDLMERTTWEPGCPVAIEDLREVTVRYVDVADAEREGEVIVHADVAEDVLDAFGQLYERRFPIERIEPIEHFDGDDGASMAANNTSAFNCRPITGSDRWSEHAYGWAIDINPIQNPYERDGVVLPPGGEPYLDRADVRPGMLTRPGAVEPFDEIGWGWGGDWTSLVDHMHLSLTGR